MIIQCWGVLPPVAGCVVLAALVASMKHDDLLACVLGSCLDRQRGSGMFEWLSVWSLFVQLQIYYKSVSIDSILHACLFIVILPSCLYFI